MDRERRPPMKLFKKLRELEAKSSPGPWTCNYDFYAGDHAYISTPHTPHHIHVRTNTTRYSEADFIAEARNAIPKLLQVIDVMQEALAEIKRRDDDPFGRWWTVAHVALEKAREIAE